MNQALVEHAQYDVDRYQRREDQHRLALERSLKGLGRALERGVNAPWKADVLFGGVDGHHRFAQRNAGRQIEKDSVMAGNWPWWLTEKDVPVGSKCVKAESGTCAAARGGDIDRGQGIRIELELGLHLEDHPILVELGI